MKIRAEYLMDGSWRLEVDPIHGETQTFILNSVGFVECDDEPAESAIGGPVTLYDEPL